MDWFRRNVRCPVCRYDIRDYVAPSYTEDENEFDQLAQELIDEAREDPPPLVNASNSRNGITSLLTNTIRSFINQELVHLPRHLNNAAELIYTFDIPISLDVSGNYHV
jgi:hypothetical protein